MTDSELMAYARKIGAPRNQIFDQMRGILRRDILIPRIWDAERAKWERISSMCKIISAAALMLGAILATIS